MRRTAALLTASFLLALSSACGGDDGDEDVPSGDATAQKGSAQCHDLLDKAAVQKLMGGEVLDPTDTTIGGLEACRWDGVTDPGASVTVVRTPAETWAEKLPVLIDQYEKTGALEGTDEASIDRARELVESGTLTGEEACSAFTTMLVELQKLPAGSTRVINWLPTRKAPQAVNIQTCDGGVYTSVQLIAGGLKGTPAEEARLAEAYDALA